MHMGRMNLRAAILLRYLHASRRSTRTVVTFTRDIMPLDAFAAARRARTLFTCRRAHVLPAILSRITVQLHCRYAERAHIYSPYLRSMTALASRFCADHRVRKLTLRGCVWRARAISTLGRIHALHPATPHHHRTHLPRRRYLPLYTDSTPHCRYPLLHLYLSPLHTTTCTTMPHPRILSSVERH